MARADQLWEVMHYSLSALLITAFATTAAAQGSPGQYPPGPPPAPAAPSPYPPYPAPAPTPPPSGATYPAYQPQPANPYVTGPQHRVGVTFESNLGIAQMIVANDNDSNSETALAGLSLGVGGFLNPRLAITARVAGGTYMEDGGTMTQWILAPNVQYWVAPSVWVGGGIGVGGVRIDTDFGDASENGLGLNARAGYTFNPTSKHSYNVSVEYASSFLDNGSISTLGFLLGWQVL